jgi:hypothetical protein
VDQVIILGLVFGALTATAIWTAAKLIAPASGRAAEVGLDGERLITGRSLLRRGGWLSALVIVLMAAFLHFEVTIAGDRDHLRSSRLWSPAIVAAVVLLDLLVFAVRFRLVILPSGLKYRRAWSQRFRFLPWDAITRVSIDGLGTMRIKSQVDKTLRLPGGLPGTNELRAAIEENAKCAVADNSILGSLSQFRERLTTLQHETLRRTIEAKRSRPPEER